MTENDLMNQIHTVIMEWCREEMAANEDSNVSLEERFEECRSQITMSVMTEGGPREAVDHEYHTRK
jgi:hypothetical protein